MNTLYYTVGNSDILIISKKGKEYTRFRNFRDVTKILYEKFQDANYNLSDEGFILEESESITTEIYDTQSGRKIPLSVSEIKFPIFVPLMSKVSKESPNLDKIFLFATDQDPKHPQDTLYATYLLKMFIKQQYKIDTEIIKITSDPSNYEEMFSFFKNFFEEKKSYIRSNLNNYIQVTAGTPAMYFSLALNFMEYPVKYFYINRKDKRAYKINTFSKLNREKYALILENLLDSYNYDMALEVMRHSPFRTHHNIEHVLQALIHLRNFNFEKALEEFRQLNRGHQKEFKFIGERSSDAISHIEKRFSLMYELLEIYIKNRQYIEAVALLSGIMDNYTKNLVEKMYGIKIERKNGHFEEFNKLCKKYNDVFTKRNLKCEDNPSLLALSILISLNKDKNYEDTINSYFRAYDLVFGEYLKYLRNLGPFAHGTVGIPENYVKLLSEAKKSIKEMLQYDGENIFDYANRKILNLISAV